MGTVPEAMAPVDELRARGIAPAPWDDALAAADRRAVLAEPYRGMADLDAPLPEPGGDPGFSPRGAVLSLRALDVDDGDRVLVAGPGGRYAARVAEARAGEGAHVASLDEAEGEWDRILLTRSVDEAPPAAVDALEELGTLLHLVDVAGGAEVVKVVRSGDGVAEVRLDEAAPAEDPWGTRGRGPPPDGRLGELLGVEAGLRRVWTDEVRGPRERAWREATREVWRPDPVGDAPEARWDRARRLFRIGYALQGAGDLGAAAEVYEASLEVARSAEACTFRGWVESFRGRYREAIEWCEEAIEVDPTLGNPYNDVGCYLLELGEVDEAADWFRRALGAERYQAPHFPHLNLARVHLHRGDVDEAEEEARRCLEIEPGDPTAQALLQRIRERRR